MYVKLNYTAVRPSLLREIPNGTAAKVSAIQALLQGPQELPATAITSEPNTNPAFQTI